MNNAAPVRVWDLPTRLFHWAIVVLIGMSWWSAENHAMDWHRTFGLIALGLILFRLIWGLIGGSTARFASFLRSPGSVVSYLGSNGPRRAGHNPLGGYSVIAMLLVIVLQVGTGLFAVDVDGIESGYLSHLVSFDQGRLASKIHETSFNVLLALIGLHILAILFYLVVRRRNLVRPMVTGTDRQVETADGALVSAGPVKFVVAAGMAASIAWWAGTGFGL
jgi:cytochrome b